MNDIIGGIGLIFIVIGVGLITIPGAFIVLGISLVALAIIKAKTEAYS